MDTDVLRNSVHIPERAFDRRGSVQGRRTTRKIDEVHRLGSARYRMPARQPYFGPLLKCGLAPGEDVLREAGLGLDQPPGPLQLLLQLIGLPPGGLRAGGVSVPCDRYRLQPDEATRAAFRIGRCQPATGETELVLEQMKLCL